MSIDVRNAQYKSMIHHKTRHVLVFKDILHLLAERKAIDLFTTFIIIVAKICRQTFHIKVHCLKYQSHQYWNLAQEVLGLIKTLEFCFMYFTSCPSSKLIHWVKRSTPYNTEALLCSGWDLFCHRQTTGISPPLTWPNIYSYVLYLSVGLIVFLHLLKNLSIHMP